MKKGWLQSGTLCKRSALYVGTMREAFDTLAPFLSVLIGLRKGLHEKPGLSGTEEHTAEKIRDFFSQYEPGNIFSGIGVHGTAVVFEGKKPGQAVF